jgi:hypothetical protein
MRKTKRLTRPAWILAAALLVPGPALTAPEEKESQFEIELLVFEQRFPHLLGDEQLAEERRGRAASERSVAVEPAATGTPRLAAMAEQLARDPHYRVLAHERWLQPSEPRSVAAPRRIHGTGHESEVDGSVRFYATRFLHLDANLTLRADGRSYQLAELRRLRLNDLHYFDHPRFGMLARVSQPDKEKPGK